MTTVARPPGTVTGAEPVAIACRALSVDAGGRRLLSDVSLSVAPGEWLGVLGPNGAGKTTLLRALAGLVRHGGEVALGGRPAERLSRRRRARLVAFVPQAPVLPPGLTVGEYVLLGRTPHVPLLGSESAADLAAVGRALDQLDLGGLTDRVLYTLSGGERQRVLLARALAQESPVVLLDEPTTALDIGHQQDVLELVDGLRRARSLTVVSTLHDLTLAGRYAPRLVLLDGGRVVAEGPPAAVVTEESVRRHFGAAVRIVADEDGLTVVPRRPGPPGGPLA